MIGKKLLRKPQYAEDLNGSTVRITGRGKRSEEVQRCVDGSTCRGPAMSETDQRKGRDF